MDADTASTIMEALDQAEALLNRMHLRDGYAGPETLARNRELLNAARDRLEQVHSVEGMESFDCCGFGRSPAMA